MTLRWTTESNSSPYSLPNSFVVLFQTDSGETINPAFHIFISGPNEFNADLNHLPQQSTPICRQNPSRQGRPSHLKGNVVMRPSRDRQLLKMISMISMTRMTVLPALLLFLLLIFVPSLVRLLPVLLLHHPVRVAQLQELIENETSLDHGCLVDAILARLKLAAVMQLWFDICTISFSNYVLQISDESSICTN